MDKSTITRRGYLPLKPGSDFGPSVTEYENGSIIFNCPGNRELHERNVPPNRIDDIYWYNDEEIKIFYPQG